jgi:hypothetical protein
MTIGQAWRDGMRRVNAAPAILLGAWATTILVSAPLALAIRESIEAHLGASVEAEAAAAGVNYDWMQEFASQASGLATTLRPSVIGFGAVLDNLTAFLDGARRPALIAGAVALYLGLWMFAAAGIIDRFARERRVGPHGFFAACGVYAFRFLRLGLIAGAVYALLFGSVKPWLLGDLFTTLTDDTTAERTAFAIRASLYLLFGAALAMVNLLFDYAKVRTVVEDRRSMVGSTIAAARFLRMHAASAVPLYFANVGLFAVVLGVYALAAPGAGSTGISMWVGVAAGQAYVLARLWVKLTFWASALALFQSRLAHAGYVARPSTRWPESPAVEAIARGT